MDYERNPQNQWRFIAMFSFFAMLGTYSGVAVSDLSYRAAPWIGSVTDTAAIANSRTVGVVIAGLLGGVKPGLIVGLIAGIHRYTFGGFVAFACMTAPIIQGIFAGAMRDALKRRYRHISSVQLSFLVGFIAESIQMLLILLLAKPHSEAFALVYLIGIPQTLTNSIGVALFFILYIQMKNEEERVGAKHAVQVLRIADMTLSQWTKPLMEAAKGVALILVQETQAVGALFESERNIMVMEGKKTCYSITVPIHSGMKKIGSFQLFYEREQELGAANRIVLSGLTQLFSQQYAFVETERQAQLLADAENRALQAQMNPHFLFNVLNTIKSFIRTKPEEARQMITQLGKYLRQNMQSGNNSLITVEEELEHVEAYLNLVKYRMGDRLEITRTIDKLLLEHAIPPFSIQPLVENAIVHGVSKIQERGKIHLDVSGKEGKVFITVNDNGVWVEKESKEKDQEHLGFALSNLEQRLRFHFGLDDQIQIETSPDSGTKVSFWVR